MVCYKPYLPQAYTDYNIPYCSQPVSFTCLPPFFPTVYEQIFEELISNRRYGCVEPMAFFSFSHQNKYPHFIKLPIMPMYNTHTHTRTKHTPSPQPTPLSLPPSHLVSDTEKSSMVRLFADISPISPLTYRRST